MNFVKSLGKVKDAIPNALGISSSNTLRNVLDPSSKLSANYAAGKPVTGATALDPGGFVLPSAKQSLNPASPIPTPPGPPNQDVAANAARQQNDLLRRRRGVYANIFSSNASPVVSNKSALGG